MARIVLVDGGKAPRLRLDADPAEACEGYRNLLPGYHELRVDSGGGWIGAALVVRPDDTARLRIGDGHLEAAPEAPAPDDAALVDAVARDARRARAWQAATSALDPGSVHASLVAPAPPPAGLRELQAAFVRAWLHGDGDARAPLTTIARAWAAEGGDGLQNMPDAAARIGRALAGMVTLFPSLAPELPIDDLIAALSHAGNELADGDLLAAANQLQILVSE